MRKLVPAFAACIAAMLPLAPNVHADLGTLATATLSCTDGHSVVVTVDQLALADLASDVQAINASGTTLCTLDTAAVDPSSESGEWTVYDYNASGQAIAPRNAPSKMPATTPDGGATWQFDFRQSVYTALFTTTDPNLTGALCGPVYPAGCRYLNDTITLSGDAPTFMTQHNGGNCASNFPAAVRFFFVSPSASGSSVGSPPAGFYTRFWWSNPVNLVMGSGNQLPALITAYLGDPNQWSDWNGQRGSSSPEVTEAFIEATQKVQSIGLSFGGECFFETGVTPQDPWNSERFASQFGES